MPKDPTEAMRNQASAYPLVDQGTACTQSSFKAKKKAFLFCGPQGGRFKAMFKLDASMSQAAKLAEAEPDRFEVGNTGWVTARFSADAPMPKKIWSKWLDESYAMATAGGGKKKAAPKKASKKATTRKKVTKKASSKKKTTKKKVSKKTTPRKR